MMSEVDTQLTELKINTLLIKGCFFFREGRFDEKQIYC